MDKRARIGYSMTLEDAIVFYARKVEAEKALGQKLTSDEAEKLLQAMQLGQELSLEELLEIMQGKKVLIVENKSHDGL